LERLKYSTITNNIFHLFTKFLYLYLTMAAQVPIQAQAQVPPAVQPAVQPQVQFLLWNVATALATVGFTAAQVAILQAESFPTLESFRTKTEEMIQNLAKSMESRRANQNRVPFGLARIERTIALMHWIQDHYRMGENPNHHGPNDFDDNAIVEALENAQFRESLKESSKIASDAADPGKFAKGMDWFQWYRQFQNYMSCIPGTTGIPLAYVIRPNDAPIIDPNATYAMHLINRAPLVGRVFDTDKQHAHQILVGHLTEDTTAWIATVVDQKNARLDVHALRRFYEGDGNVSRRITEGDRLRETLHYKSEKAMTFSDFVQKSNRMFMIYEQEEGRPWLESQKITWLFKAISGASHLAGLKSSLEVKLGEGTLTYEFAVNTLSRIWLAITTRQSTTPEEDVLSCRKLLPEAAVVAEVVRQVATIIAVDAVVVLLLMARVVAAAAVQAIVLPERKAMSLKLSGIKCRRQKRTSLLLRGRRIKSRERVAAMATVRRQKSVSVAQRQLGRLAPVMQR
jgi:hypothetical protein